MVTRAEEDYRKDQFKIWLPKMFIKEFKRYVSRKWPVYNHGILSLEVQLAMKMWMENDRRPAHTHKNTVFTEAENKPNFHAAKTKGKLIMLNANSPDSMTALTVRGNDGNGNGNGKGKEHWKRPINEDPLLVDWAKKIGMGDVFDNPRNILKYASQETIDNVRRCMDDPEFDKQYHEGLVNRLKARKKQLQYQKYKNALDERDKELRPELVLIKKHLENHSTIVIVDQNKIREQDLYDAFIVATSKDDKRTFNKRLEQYIMYGYFTRVKVVKTEAYKMEDKFLQL